MNVVLKENDEAKQIYDSYKIDYINQGISCEEAVQKQEIDLYMMYLEILERE